MPKQLINGTGIPDVLARIQAAWGKPGQRPLLRILAGHEQGLELNRWRDQSGLAVAEFDAARKPWSAMMW